MVKSYGSGEKSGEELRWFKDRYGRREFLRRVAIVGGVMTVLPLAGTLSGCGSQAGETTSSGTPTSTGGGGKTVNITAYLPAGYRFGDPVTALTPKFQEKNPDIKVKIITEPLGTYLGQKVATAMAAGGSDYDIVMGAGFSTDAWAGAGKVANISKLMRKEFKDDYEADNAPLSLSQWTYPPGGDYYALQNDANAIWQSYRKDVFDELGLKPAANWTDLPDLVKKVDAGLKSDKAQGKDWPKYAWASHLQAGMELSGVFEACFYSFGGRVFDPDWNPGFDTEAGRNALDIFKAIMPYVEPGSKNAPEEETQSIMGQTGVAAYVPSAWGGSIMQHPSSKYAKFIDTAVVPPAGSHPSSPLLGGIAFFIPAASKNQEAAYRYLEHLCSKEVQLEFAKATGQPSRKTALNDPEVIKYVPFGPTMWKSLEIAVPWPRIPEAFPFWDLVGRPVSAFLNDQISRDECIKQLNSGVKDLLDKGGWLKSGKKYTDIDKVYFQGSNYA